MIIAGVNIWEWLGQETPSWWTWFTNNKIYACMMVFFLCNAIEGQLVSTGAFEISFNGKFLYCHYTVVSLCFLCFQCKVRNSGLLRTEYFQMFLFGQSWKQAVYLSHLSSFRLLTTMYALIKIQTLGVKASSLKVSNYGPLLH